MSPCSQGDYLHIYTPLLEKIRSESPKPSRISFASDALAPIALLPFL